MPANFIITKVCPVVAILFIYWLGSFNLPNIYFLPIAAATVILLIYITKKFGDKSHDDSNTETEKK